MFSKKINLAKVANSVKPEQRQIAWQETELAAHVYFSLNTFVSTDEGTGRTEPQAFYPTDIDISSWVKTFKIAGMKGVLITAKHHDGFLIWPSKTTAYTVEHAPYLDGNGDIIRELSDECRKEGLKFGFSFSLCDRNTKKRGKEFDDFVCAQLEELLKNYGEIYEVKFDFSGEKIQDYDLKRYYDLIRKLQPNAAITNGLDARYVGNSRAVCRPEEWSVVTPVNAVQKIFKIDENAPNTFRTPDGEGKMQLDLGSRKALKKTNSLSWQPFYAEAKMRESLFYNKEEELRSMLLQKFKDLYFSVVGGNGVLELAVPIDRRGRIHEEEALTLESFGIDMDMLKRNPLVKNSSVTKSENEIVIDFGKEKIIKLIELGENIANGQQIERFSFYTLEKGNFKKAETHSIVGYKKLILPKKPTVTSAIKIVIEKTREFYDLKTLEIYSA